MPFSHANSCSHKPPGEFWWFYWVGRGIENATSSCHLTYQNCKRRFLHLLGMVFVHKVTHAVDGTSPFLNLFKISWPIMCTIIISAGYAAFIIWLLVISIIILINFQFPPKFTIIGRKNLQTSYELTWRDIVQSHTWMVHSIKSSLRTKT